MKSVIQFFILILAIGFLSIMVYRSDIEMYIFDLYLDEPVVATADDLALVDQYKKRVPRSLPDGLYSIAHTSEDKDAMVQVKVYFDSDEGVLTITMLGKAINDVEDIKDILQHTASATYSIEGSVISPVYVSGKRGLISDYGVPFDVDEDGNLSIFSMIDGEKSTLLFERVK